MDKKRILGIILGAILVFAVCFKFYLDYKDMNNDEPTAKTNDTLKFKEEYESLNGTEVAEDYKYNDVKIAEDIPIYYKTDKEIVSILENETGVIYFGFNSCPWCRSMIETLFEVVKDNDIDNFYYVDIKDIRSKYEVKDKKLEKTEEGTEDYYKILEVLDSYLSDYIITDDKEKEYDTKEKRLYAPTVVVVKEGEIVGFHVGTVESQTDPFAGLNEEEQEVLYNTFNEMISKLKDTSCEKPGC